MKNLLKLPGTRIKALVVSGLVVSILITGLNAQVTFTNPLGNAYKSTENGGTLPAIDAYKDGIGVVVLDNQGTGFKIDNTPMNTLVYKYGETAKNNNVLLDEAVLNDTTSTNKDKEMAGNITNIVSGNLTSPINVDGTTCNDGNAATVGEKWLNGVCTGGVIGTLAGNGLIYDNCEGGRRIWVNAKIYCENKGMRLPTLKETTEGVVFGVSGELGVPRCDNGWSWTSTDYHGDQSYRYLWGGQSVELLWLEYNHEMDFRCVK